MTTQIKRLDALERRAGGPAHYVILLGDDCDAFDRALASGDAAAALAVLQHSNPHAAAEVLAGVVRGRSPERSLDGALTLVRVAYTDPGADQ